jgi:hypothetical protein
MRSGHFDARAWDPAAVDSVPILDWRPRVAGTHVDQGRVAALYVLQRQRNRPGKQCGFVGHTHCDGVHDVDVSVDQSRYHGRVTEIDNLGSGRNLDEIRRAHRGDDVSVDDNDLVGKHTSGFRVKQPAGANDTARARGVLQIVVRQRTFNTHGFGGHDLPLIAVDAITTVKPLAASLALLGSLR